MNTTKPVTRMMDYLPHLSLAERDRRWDQIRKKMLLNGFDCLLLWGNDAFYDMGMVNFRYLTHVGSKLGGLAIFPVEGEPVVFCNPPHMNIPVSAYRHTQEWVSDIRANVGVPAVAETLREMGYEKARIGVVSFGSVLAGHTLPYAGHTRMMGLLPQAEFVEATPLLDEMRLIKSPEEIHMLEIAGGIARKTIEALIQSARPGVKECEVYADMVRAQIANGSEAQIFNLLASGPMEGGDPDAHKHLLHGIEQPITPTTRPLANGDIVICEFHSNYGGYLTATEFTVCIGKAPPQIRKIHQASMESQRACIDQMRPGATLRSVWEAARAPVEKAGLDFVELGFHGHGMASPEFPTVVYRTGAGLMSGERLGDLVLQEGMVFGLNCDVHDPRWKKDVGCMFGDCVVIEAKGARRLVGIPEELMELGV